MNLQKNEESEKSFEIESINSQTLLNANNNNNDIINQSYFKFCGVKRRLPGNEDIGGIIMTPFAFFIPTTKYIVLNIILFKYNNNKIEIKNRILFLYFSIVSIVTFIISIASFFDVATSIPGYQRGNEITKEEFKAMDNNITIKNVNFKRKFCETCKIVRDIRTFHCKYCGRCIERHDHHCGYVSNCIGKENLKNFFIFLVVSFIHAGFIEITSVYAIINITSGKSNTSDDKLIVLTVLYAVLIMLGGFFFVFIIVMLCQHFFLISSNQTTNEGIRNRYDSKVFDKGCVENWREVCSKERFI